LRSEGWLGGGQIGFNYQTGPIVLGAEAQFSWTDLEASTRANNPTIAGRYSQARSNTDWITTVAARFGVAIQNILLYGKAGAAWAEADNHAETFTGGNQLISTTTGTTRRQGWMAGAGIEYGFAPSWSAKIEYNYIDLGTDHQTRTQVNTAAFGGTTTSVLRDVDTEIHLLKVGINYRFNFASRVGAGY
jgi:outer membrane immunogenic protein